MKKIILIIIVLLISLALQGERKSSNIIWNKGIIQSKALAGLNISKNGQPLNEFGSVISINRGRTLAYREAEMRARANLMKELKKIHISSGLSVDSILSDPLSRKKLSHIIRFETNVKLYPVNFMQSGCEIKLKLKTLIKAIPVQFPQDNFPTRDDIEVSTEYTSLIIDTRELSIRPMIFPVVYNESGLEVYSKIHINPQFINNSGIVSYVFNEREAYKHKNAGTKPFLTAALKNLKNSPVISDKDIKKIFSSKITLKHLKRCKVIFIIDRS